MMVFLCAEAKGSNEMGRSWSRSVATKPITVTPVPQMELLWWLSHNSQKTTPLS